MYNFYKKNDVQPPGCMHKFLMIMKLTTLIMITVILHVSAATLAQKVTLTEKNAPLVDVFNQINAQTGYDFLFTTSILNGARPVTINVKNEELTSVLNKIFEGQPLDFSIENKSVVISARSPTVVVSGQEKPPLLLLLGNVVDEKGLPLVGVTIRLKGTPQDVLPNVWTTSKDGKFNVLLSDDKGILQFSFIGYQTRELVVKDMKNPMTVELKVSVGSLDEIQVLAYGTVSKRLNTGDVVTIGAAEIAKHPVANVLQAIQNQIPGYFVQQETGNFGSAFNTNIRGGNSVLTNGIPPLYIVDGVQYPGGTQPFIFGLGINTATNSPVNRGGNLLNYLNPDDIESFSVLKDADATALYGSRGAYGVIIIKTKKGRSGTPTLTVNMREDITTAGYMPSLLNTEQYLMIRREAFKNDGATPGAGDLDLNGTWPTDRYTNWRKYYMGKTGHNQIVNLSYQGGTEQNTFLMSGHFSNQRSIQGGKGGQIDGGARMGITNTSRNKKFSIDFSATYNLSRNDAVPLDFMYTLTTAPNAPLPLMPDGSLDWTVTNNPYAALNAMYLNTNNNLLSSLTLRYNITNDLTFNTTLGYSLNTNKEFRALPTTYFVPSATVSTQTTSTINTFNNTNITLDPNVQYTHTFFKQLQVDSRVGFTAQSSNNSVLSTTGSNFASDQLLTSPTNGGTVNASYSNTPNRYLGIFGTARLNWANKYLLSLNVRRDGSTKFGPDHRYGDFGSIAGAWILSEEPWMKSLNKVLPFVKIRASYGTTGGDNVVDLGYLNTFNISSSAYAGGIAYLPARIANPDLHWEAKRSEEVGTTLQFLNGRIEIDASAYRNWTSDPLYPVAVSSLTGFTTANTNLPGAKLLNWGYEATVTSRNIQSKNFGWSTSFNIGVPHSKLVAFPGLDNKNNVSATNYRLRLGQPTTGIALFNYAGVNPETGNYSFINAQGVKGDFNLLTLDNVKDRTQYIDLSPKYYGGIRNSFNYKNLSLDFFVMFTKQIGQKPTSQISVPGAFNVNYTTDVLNRWQKPGDITDFPKASQSFLTILSNIPYLSSTGAYTDVTYARLQNVNINYKLTGKWLNQANIKTLSLFLSGQNLYTISKYKSIDPQNLNANSLGPLRVFAGGLNISL